jgi:signal transduction histidine kinase
MQRLIDSTLQLDPGLAPGLESSPILARAVSLMTGTLEMCCAMILLPGKDGAGLRVLAAVGGERETDFFDVPETGFVRTILLTNQVVSIEDFHSAAQQAMRLPMSVRPLRSGIGVRFCAGAGADGVLAAIHDVPRRFSSGDVQFVRMLADALARHAGIGDLEKDRNPDHKKIAQAKLEWEATVDALPHFVCLLDSQRRIMRVNRSAGEWMVGPTRDVRGHTVHEVLHPGCNDPLCYMDSFGETAWTDLSEGHPAEFEVEDRVLRRYLNVQIRPTARHRSESRPHSSFAVVLLHDISEIKQAERVMKNYRHQLEKKIQLRTAELVDANQQLRREIEERRQIEETLRRSESEMRLMSEQILTAQEIERKRIAADLHDGIGQTLSAIKFSLESALGVCAAKYGSQEIRRFDDIILMMQRAVEEVRRISMDLHPSTLSDLGILPTIAWFCREFRVIYTGIRLETTINLDEKQVPAPLKTVIFRILQEALNNIVKHAKAQSVHLRLGISADSIELEIRDNGVGFDHKANTAHEGPKTGFGVTGMRERAEFSGGRLQIRSAPGQGTAVHVSWPLQG